LSHTFAVAQVKQPSKLFSVLVNEKVGFIDTDGKMVIAPQFQGAGDFVEGRAFVAVSGDKYKLGYIDEAGSFIVPAQFDAARDFSEGLAAVGIGNFGIHGEGNHKWGFIDRDGRFAIEPKFKEVKAFSEDLAAVMNEHGKWGFIDRNGKLAIPYNFDDAFSYSEGLACVMINGLFGFIDKSGNVVIEPRYLLPSKFKEGLAPVKTGKFNEKPYRFYGTYIAPEGQFAFIDMSGKAAFTLGTEVKRVNSFSEGLALVAVATKHGFPFYGYIDRAGKMAIEPKYFGFALDFSEGLALISVKDKIGFIDKTGKIVIKPEFSYGTSFRNGLAAVEKGKTAADFKAPNLYIDRSGTIIWRLRK